MVLTTPNNTTLVKSSSASVPQPEVVCCPLESYRYSILSYAISKVIRIYLLGDAPVCNPRKMGFCLGLCLVSSVCIVQSNIMRPLKSFL